MTTRPPQPAAPPGGFTYRIVPDEEWQKADEDTRCRGAAGIKGTIGCTELATVKKRTANPIFPWYAYCNDHARANGSWIEGGTVMKWDLRHLDGSPVTPAELAAARARKSCAQHHGECKPWDRHGHSMRFRDDTWNDVEQAADDMGVTATTWVTEAIEAALGYVRCQKCPLDANPVPLVFGNLQGKPLGSWIAEAVEAAARQHPRHQAVRVGVTPVKRSTAPAEPPEPLSRAREHAAVQGAVLPAATLKFRSPDPDAQPDIIPYPVPEVPARRKKGLR